MKYPNTRWLLLLFILFFTLPRLWAQTEKTFTLQFNQVPLSKALDSLEVLSGKRFFYSGSKLKGEHLVQYTCTQTGLKQILKDIIPNHNLQITEEGNKLILHIKQAKKYTLHGYVREMGSKENLIGVNILAANQNAMTQSNQYGYFSLTLEEGEHTIRFSYIGYKNRFLPISIHTDIEQIVFLETESQMKELLVKSEQEDKTNGINRLLVPVNQLSELPAFLGSNDPLRFLTLMPGVTKGNESNQGMFVRGGTPDQNLVMIDDATIYSAYHLFGLNSLFTGSELRKAELTKGGFSAKYGGRTSSVLNISLKDGNREKWEGDIGIGLLASYFQVNGPVKKDKSGMLISFRRTYLDAIALPLQPENEKTAYYYYDLTSKLNFDLNSKNRIYLSLYSGQDKFTYKYSENGSQNNIAIAWGNNAFSGRWNLATGKKSFLNTTLFYTSYKSSIGMHGKDSFTSNSIDMLTGINDLGIKTDFDWMPGSRHWIKLGVGYIQHTLLPNIQQKDEKNFQSRVQNQSGNISGNEWVLYAEDLFRIRKNISLSTGLRISSFQIQDKLYVVPEPRIQIEFQPVKRWVLNASYSHMTQYLNLISSGMLGLPSEIWIPASKKLKPQIARQVSAGSGYTINSSWYVGNEIFYKSTENVSSYKEGIGFLNIFISDNTDPLNAEYFENLLTQGRSVSYGTEFYIKYSKRKIESWISYTLAKTTQLFTEINRGQEFDAYYDRRHDLSFVFIAKPSTKWSASLSWVYGSGFAITLPESQYTAPVHIPNDPNGMPIGFENYFPVYHYKQKNNYRTQNFHKLDASITYKIFRRRGTHFIGLSVYNAYNRQNPLYYSINYDEKLNKNVLVQTSLFPIIPSVNWKYAF